VEVNCSASTNRGIGGSACGSLRVEDEVKVNIIATAKRVNAIGRWWTFFLIIFRPPVL
jgi:hypothetical protein